MSTNPGAAARPSLLVLAITYLAFISLGLPDSVLGVAWPTMRESLRLPLEAVGVLTLLLTVLSAGASFVSGNLTKRFSTGPIILVSCLATSSALFLISGAPSFVFLLLAAIPLGLGAGSVDSGLNAYVAKHYSARHMNWLHSFWGGGATLGPIVMTAALGVGVGWRGGYLWIASAQLVLVVLFLITLPLWNRNEKRVEAQTAGAEAVQGTKAANSAEGWMSVGLYILYAVAEMGIGLWANSLMLESRHLDAATSGLFVACYFGAIMGGRMAMGFLVPLWGNRRSVTYGLVLSLVGAALFLLPVVPGFQNPLFSVGGLVLMGLGFAPVYPCLMHETPRRFTADAAPVVIGRQVGAAYVGGALFPGAIGWTMAHVHLEVLTPIVVVAVAALLLLTARLNRTT